jgi:hypothetical protein
MRHILSTALVALIVAALTAVTVSAVAQSPAQLPVEATALNADTVDRLSAVKATNRKAARANKLVAADATGFLPSNIVKAKWELIGGKPATLADGLVSWNEVQGIPASLADGVDDAGITGVTVTRVQGPKSAPQADGVTFAYAYCPEGTLLVGGGADIDTGNDQTSANLTHFLSNQPGGPRNWFARAWKQLGTSGSYQVQAFAICLSTEPAGNLILAGKVNRAATKKAR